MPPPRSTCGLPPFADRHTKPRIGDFSSADLADGIRRVKGVKKHGMRRGNWLTADQGKGLLAAFGADDVRG